jgi:hypothetical protein
MLERQSKSKAEPVTRPCRGKVEVVDIAQMLSRPGQPYFARYEITCPFGHDCANYAGYIEKIKPTLQEVKEATQGVLRRNVSQCKGPDLEEYRY